MTEEKLEFEIRTGKITIDYSRCEPAIKNSLEPSCGFACVKACRLYGRNVLRIEGNIPVLTVTDAAEIKRMDNECLACEYACWSQGTGCISIELPLPGIDEYRKKTLSAKPQIGRPD